jgi:serine protease Do
VLGAWYQSIESILSFIDYSFMKSKQKKYIALSMAAFAGSASLLGSTALAVRASEKNNDKPPLDLKVDDAAINRSGTLTNSFAPIVKQVAPSVVQINVTAKGDSQVQDPQMQMFRHFFGNQFDFPQRQPDQNALGSGVIVSADGYILTNNHVVKNAKTIKVQLSDGRNFTGKVIGTDEKSDVALIKVSATGLPAITFADSAKVEVGDMVLAIGDPFGVGQSVTSGIVSAEHRSAAIAGAGSDSDEDFLQTDAAINPGNSGGALVDTQGRLVGINTAILSRSGGNQGVGFAVPSNLCRWVMESLIKNGTVKRGMLGVLIRSLDPNLAQSFKLDRTKGALVTQVNPGSPADSAGIKNGDVITGFNGKPVEDSSGLKVAVAETTPGTTVPVQVQRGGQTQTMKVTVKELSAKNNDDDDGNKKDNGEALAGVGVGDLDADARQQLNAPTDLHGAVITQVDPDSAAANAGLRRGDVITEINHKPVKSAADADRLTKHRESNVTLVRFWRSTGQDGDSGYSYVAVEEDN